MRHITAVVLFDPALPPAKDTPLDLSLLKNHLKERLPDYMVPSHFELIAEIPLTATGKANRNALPEPELVKR